jgi:photosystem II stability/assembly factor-like uncharacterized protein
MRKTDPIPVIARTNDGGKNWEITHSGYVQNNSSLFFMFFFNYDTGFISTNDSKVYFTSDGGKNFVLSATNDSLNKLIGSNIYANEVIIQDKKSSKIFKTSDYGKTWVQVNADIGTHELRDIRFLNLDIGYAHTEILDSFYFYKTIDGGKNWIRAGNFPYQPYSPIFTSENIGYIIGYIKYQEYDIFKTTDGGKTWNSKSNGLPIDKFNTLKNLFFSDDKNGWISVIAPGNINIIYRTIDGGENWRKLAYDDFVCALSGFTGVDTNNMVLWPHNNGTCIYRTTNGGGAYSGIKHNIISESTNSLFPNPAQNTFTIKCEGCLNKQTKAIIYNTQGKIVKELLLNQTETDVDIANLPKGLYLVKVVDEKGVWVSKMMKE